MNKMLFAALAFMAALAFTAPAQAGEQDVAKITCQDFLKQNEKNMGLMLMWIDGYLSAESDDTVMDDDYMEKLGTHMGSYCAKNPSKTIMDAMKALAE